MNARILVKRGFTVELAELLVEDIKVALKHFTLNPVKKDVHPLERGLKSAYSHT